MATVVRIPITNVFAEGDYTGVILMGPAVPQPRLRWGRRGWQFWACR